MSNQRTNTLAYISGASVLKKKRFFSADTWRELMNWPVKKMRIKIVEKVPSLKVHSYEHI